MITEYNESIFESIKHINDFGQEYWLARELQIVLAYSEWRNFSRVIAKAKEASKNSNNQISEHFVDVNKISMLPQGGERIIEDIELSRYACYLIVQNGDPKKQVIALGQTYFAIKTRQQELIENYDNLSEDEKRLAVRNEIKEHNKALADAAHKAGVVTPIEYATFQNKGYQGLYGGLNAKDIKQRKNLKQSQNILDHMGHEELAANLFRATQTESKLRRDNIQGKEKANATHFEVGKAVRDTIKELGGTMPENLPKPEKSIQEIEKNKNKPLK